MVKVLIAGGYDIIHSGHIFRINQARTFGDYLIVNITPDIRMKRKGENRPYLLQEERMLIVGNIKGVNEVVSIPSSGESHEDYEKKMIGRIKPDIFITEPGRGWQEINTFNGCKIILLEETVGIDKKHSRDILK